MAIYHDAYHFKPDEFADTVLPFVRELQKRAEGQQQLHEAVLERFEQSSRAQALAMEYGGWDIGTLYDVAARPEPNRPQDTARWILFLLYDYLYPVPSELGLQDKWRVMGSILDGLGWHTSDRPLLIHGHSFGYFAQVWIADRAESQAYAKGDLEYWEHVWPGSTASQIGWLDYADVRRLLHKLETDQTRLAEVTLQSIDAETIRQSYQLALQMLRSASEARCGLCLITSG
jgi:hypothetical protein